ncbi:MAG: VOC family protein [Actinobacteria bacterium]|nr:VOC family protein [Actinomycetota bacterium]
MSERTSYAPGTPCWIDIGTDVEAAKAFYGGLFGWEFTAAGPPEETGGYGMFAKNGKTVAGVGPQQSPGPPFWTTYVAVADADATAITVKENGGQEIVAPMDVMTAGRMAVFQDPEGAFFSVWQLADHRGAELVNEPGAWSWNELNTRNLDAAKSFYSAVFGWECVTQDMGGGMSYTEVKLDGNSVAGMMDMPAQVPEMVPAHWLVYITVEDPDATAAKAHELGGAVMMPPMDIPPGRFAVLADDRGAAFAVIRMNEPQP